MNGMSDVRLALYQQELLSLREGAVAAQPAQESRWQRFWRRVRTRRQLLDLSDDQLRDIGLSREQARREALQPFWRC